MRIRLEKIDKLSDIFGGAFACFMIGSLFTAGVISLIYVNRAKQWKTTPGKIEHSRIKIKRISTIVGDEVYPQLDILYSYKVNSKLYLNDDISPGRKTFSEAIYKRYPRGKKVIVYYKPGNPKVAMLEPGFGWGNFEILFFSGMFIFIGILYIVFVLYDKYEMATVIKQLSIRRK